MRYVLWKGVLATDRSNTSFRSFASFGEGVVPGIEILALLTTVSMMGRLLTDKPEESLTLSLFCRRSFLLGSLPYRRNNFCSSSLRDCNNTLALRPSA